jgi:sarcosine oxidase subunit alpha
MTSSRLAAPYGQGIDRSRLLSFEFNGQPMNGHPGDTLASALLANDVRLVGRSFKLHRPRGIFSCGVEEPTALVDLGEGATRTPNVRATQVELYEGLVAASVNCWPSVEFDLGAINSRISALLPAGFYYKTFKWPNWHLFEPAIRRMAGLGRASGEPDPDRYEEASAQAEVLIVGGGLAGLSAAVAAAEAGADTLLLASSATLGGALGWQSDPEIDDLILRARRSGLRQMTRTLAFGIYDHNLVCARETLRSPAARAPAGGVLRERLW